MLKSLIRTAALISLCAGLTWGADEVGRAKGAEEGAPPSYGFKVDGNLHASDLSSEDATGKIPGSFEAEVKQALENLAAILKGVGMSLPNVVNVEVYITDDAKSSRPTVVLSKLVGPAQVEITVTAKK